ncbi:amino acid racemase [Enterococcus sp. CSURQ0835]|uniref:amino acid racemase n=1 Tax=Enterococcus sp. CSURQ0835 TaxID=2681394 RepID=UPI001357BF10|nr:amino acid racemase [Enterococcus sp. CSURQ0835]
MENFFSVLGGMGTMATESFVRLINHRITAHKDQDYLNYILFNHATVPDRTAYILDPSQTDPRPYLLDDVKKQNLLQPNFIVLTCNTAHYFYDAMQAETKIPILHMPKEAAKDLKRRHPEGGKVAILGTEGSIKADIYPKELRAEGFEVLIPDEKLQSKVNHLIYTDVKENDFINSELFLEILHDVFTTYGCQHAVLGCTELSLVNELTQEVPYEVTDAQSILADRTIERALAQRNH